MRRNRSCEIADVQNSVDTRRIAINKGYQGYPASGKRVKDRSDGEQHTIATFNMYVNLPTISRAPIRPGSFQEVLNSHEREISVSSFKEMLTEMPNAWRPGRANEMKFPTLSTKAPYRAYSLLTTKSPSQGDP